MSAAPVHADNAAQAEYWTSVAGPRWTDHQEHQDEVLRPVSDRLIAAAAPEPAVLADVVDRAQSLCSVALLDAGKL